MERILIQKLETDSKMALYLKENSYWFKELNRNSDYYTLFVKEMKEKYHLKVSDKLNEAIDGIDIVTSILENLK